MVGDSRPPLSHLRPTLSTRLRRSFEGKRPKPETLASGINGAGGHTSRPDPEVLQTVIEQAINSEAFQNAIAANLANIIKPSIKSALDTIQPVVEAVYAHDVLLRKTHRGVEDMLEKMDTIPEEDDGRGGASPYERSGSVGSYYDMEFKALLEKSNKRTVATLAELSNAVQINNSKVAGLETAFGQSSENIEYIKSFVQNEMDQLQREVGRISQVLDSQKKAYSNTHSLFSAHATKLDLVSSDLAGLKGPTDVSEKLESVSGELNALRASVDAGQGSNSGGFGEIGSKIDNLATALESHGSMLQEVRQVDSSQDILAALKQSNDSHTLHATTLGELKQRSLVPLPADNTSGAVEDSLQEIQSHLVSLKEDISSSHTSHNDVVNGLRSKLDHVLATIEDQQATDPSAEIMDALKKANDSHDSHALVLREIKERSLAPAVPVESDTADTALAIVEIKSTLEALKENILSTHTSSSDHATGISTKIDSLLRAIEAQNPVDSSADILAALHKLNDSHTSHASALDGIKSLVVVPTPHSDNRGFDRVEEQLQTIINTLHTHTTSLTNVTESSSLPPRTDETLKSEVTTIITTLTSHTKLLNEIKEDISAEILTSLHDIGQTQASHTASLAEIREADVSDEILTALHTSIEAHSGHQTEFEKLHGAVKGLDDKHERHGADLGEIRSRSLAPIVAPVADQSDTSELDTKIHGIASILEEHKATLFSIKQATDSALDSHSAHALSLDEIKSRSLEPVSTSQEQPILKDLETKIGNVIEILEGQSAALANIKESTSAAIESHTSSLDEIKATTSAQIELHDSHASALSEIKEASLASKELNAAHSATLADLVIATGTANDSHASHTTTLSELKSLPPPVADLSRLSILEKDLQTIIETLSQHTTTLAEIDVVAATPNPDLLSSLEKSHELLNSHTYILESLKVPSTASQDEVLASLAAVKIAVEETRANVNAHGNTVRDLHSETKDSHSSLTTAISGLALGGAAGAGIGFLASRDDNDEKGTDSSNSELLVEIKAVREIVEGGVSFNEKGLEQLKTSTAPKTSMCEVEEGIIKDVESVEDMHDPFAVGQKEVNRVLPVVLADHKPHVETSAPPPDDAKEIIAEQEATPSTGVSKSIEVEHEPEVIEILKGPESTEAPPPDSAAKGIEPDITHPPELPEPEPESASQLEIPDDNEPEQPRNGLSSNIEQPGEDTTIPSPDEPVIDVESEDKSVGLPIQLDTSAHGMELELMPTPDDGPLTSEIGTRTEILYPNDVVVLEKFEDISILPDDTINENSKVPIPEVESLPLDTNTTMGELTSHDVDVTTQEVEVDERLSEASPDKSSNLEVSKEVSQEAEEPSSAELTEIPRALDIGEDKVDSVEETASDASAEIEEINFNAPSRSHDEQDNNKALGEDLSSRSIDKPSLLPSAEIEADDLTLKSAQDQAMPDISNFDDTPDTQLGPHQSAHDDISTPLSIAEPDAESSEPLVQNLNIPESQSVVDSTIEKELTETVVVPAPIDSKVDSKVDEEVYEANQDVGTSPANDIIAGDNEVNEIPSASSRAIVSEDSEDSPSDTGLLQQEDRTSSPSLDVTEDRDTLGQADTLHEGDLSTFQLPVVLQEELEKYSSIPADDRAVSRLPAAIDGKEDTQIPDEIMQPFVSQAPADESRSTLREPASQLQDEAVSSNGLKDMVVEDDFPVPPSRDVLDSESPVIEDEIIAASGPPEDSDDDMVVEWSGKDGEAEGNAVATIPEAVVDTPVISKHIGLDVEKEPISDSAAKKELSPTPSSFLLPRQIETESLVLDKIALHTSSLPDEISPLEDIVEVGEKGLPLTDPSLLPSPTDQSSGILPAADLETAEKLPIPSTSAIENPPEVEGPPLPSPAGEDDHEPVSLILDSYSNPDYDQELDVSAPALPSRPAISKEIDIPQQSEPGYFTVPPTSVAESVKSPTFSLPEETDSEPPTPATPNFGSSARAAAEEEVVSLGDTNGGGGGRKGKKGKKTKKGKKEKVVKFEMDGEDPENA